MISEIYKVFISSAFGGFEKYYFKGTKEQLMTLIGILYSTRLVKIERISYQILKEEPDDCKQIKYVVESNGNIFTYVKEINNVKEQ